MAKRKIVRAAAKKGIVFVACELNRVVTFETTRRDQKTTSNSYVPGWTITPTDECLGRLEEAGADADRLYQDDFEDTDEALAWVEAMPDIREVRS